MLTYPVRLGIYECSLRWGVWPCLNGKHVILCSSRLNRVGNEQGRMVLLAHRSGSAVFSILASSFFTATCFSLSGIFYLATGFDFHAIRANVCATLISMFEALKVKEVCH